MAPVPVDGLTHLRVTLSETAYLGPGRADLLEQIGKTGSIAAAGKAMGMSYKRAWGLVQALNTGFGLVLVEASRGGSGQGAQLTAAGAQVLAHYRAMQDKTRSAIAQDVSALRQLIDMSAQK
ncbi:winged helix-turn-helix domain-containing protein [uncultured Devosia sp.]|uniref:winged helix-turn-helix domain-containing protein n=1 Tax=uncultured Devosia sp. TaxID=211434 RepID=UPI0035CA586B